MMSYYRCLPHINLGSETGFYRPLASQVVAVTRDDPAVMVMTDLCEVIPITIGSSATIDTANDKMIANGVRLLIVSDDGRLLWGLITASDILGERPLKHLLAEGGARGDILVRDIMTPADKLDVIHMSDVINARVGDIVETLKLFGRQHALVCETDDHGFQAIRGIFSTTQVGKQLGINIEKEEIARSFAELEATLLSS